MTATKADQEFVQAKWRVSIGAVAGIVAGAIVAYLSVWQLAVLLGWIVAAGTVLTWVWLEIAGRNAHGTEAVATRADASRGVSRSILLIASLVSLLAVFAGFRKASVESGRLEMALMIAAMFAIVAAWLIVHTVFMLHYAHMYYQSPKGGVDFPGPKSDPTYLDFAYFAFTIGMTFQVSDTEVRDANIRNMVLRHALLSYIFATAIIAATINLLVGSIP